MKVLESYYSVNQAIGISVTLLRDGGFTMEGCQVQVKDKQLLLEKKVTAVGGADQLFKHFSKDLPVSLNLSGKGILYKQLNGIANIGPDEFASIIPNAAIDDFYIQQFRSGDISFVAIIRKTDADSWISQIGNLGYRVLMLSMGPFPLQHILPQLNIYNEEIVFNGHRILRNESLQWVSYRYQEGDAPAPFPIKVDSELIDQTLLIAYAAVFQLVLALKVDPVKASIEKLETAFTATLEDKKFQVRGFMLLLACLLLLVCNFLIFSWLERNNETLTQQVSSSAQGSSVRQQLTERTRRKEAMLKELGWEGGAYKSARIDDIASLLPEGISWQQVAVNPVDARESRNRRALVFLDRRLEIRGICPQIIPVNEWIARIKSRSWVKNVQMESFNYNHELNTGEFTLFITY